MTKERVPLSPQLFSVEQPNGAVPRLKGGRCTCGYVFFPPQTYGCERCGRTAPDLQEVELTGRGRLRGFVKVHRHAQDNPKAPFIAATVILDDGPAIRALLVEDDESGLSPGIPVQATLVVVDPDRDGKEVVDLRFTARPADQTGAAR